MSENHYKDVKTGYLDSRLFMIRPVPDVVNSDLHFYNLGRLVQ